jgi:hypothetical protein
MTLPQLAEDWLRDMVVSALALLSLLGVLGAALSAGGLAWTVLGVLGGVVATVVPFVPLARHWSLLSTWLTMLTVAVFDVAVILVLRAR